ERARGIVESDSSNDALRTRVASDRAAIDGEMKLARAKDDLARDNAALLAELADMRQPEGDGAYPTDWAKLDVEHGSVFARHGIDIGAQDELAVAGALAERRISLELAAALDEWAFVRARARDGAGTRYL